MATITSNSRYIEIDGRTAIALSDNAVVNLIATGVRVKFMSGSYTDIGHEGTTVDGAATGTAQELYDWFKSKGFSSGGGAPGEGVQSVTGDGVDNTDPENPTISYPTPGDIGAATAAQGSLAETAVQPGDLPITPTWTTISGKPSFVAEGANAAAARTALGLGTAATQASGAFATAAQGALADTAVQSAQEGGVGVLVSNIIQVTQAQYDGLTPQAGTFYAIVG